MPYIIGIIAEDRCDVSSIKILIERIIKKKIGVKPYVGRGSGKLVRKCSAWAKLLYKQGCSSLIIVHDSDNNPSQFIFNKISSALGSCLFSRFLICIPVQELEAWLLSDPLGIMKAMKLKKVPKIDGEPETINSPKEYLGRVIEKASEKTRIYINTQHNEVISQFVSIAAIQKKCPAFTPFIKFVKDKVIK